MSDQRTAQSWQPTDSHRALRLLGLAAVVAGVLLLMAAAFALSYAGIHAVALSAGVSPRLARLYPLIFDAMLVVACAAVLSLRGAGLPSRCYAWLSMLVLLIAAAGADTLHATGVTLPHKPAAAAAAIIPWALVLIGFGLLLSMLRQARLRRAAAAEEEGLLEPSSQVEMVTGIDALFGPKQASGSDGFPVPNGSPAQGGFVAPDESPAPDKLPAPDGGPTPDKSPAPERLPAPDGGPTPDKLPAPGKSSGPEASPVAAAEVGARVTSPAEPAAEPTVDLAIDTEPGQDDPTSDEGSTWIPRSHEPQPTGPGHRYNGGSASAFSPAPTLAPSDAGTDDREVKAKPEPEPETRSRPEPKAKPGSMAKPEPEAKSEPEAKLEPEPKPEAEAEARPEPEAEAEPEPEPKPDAKAAPEAVAKAEPEPEAKAESQPEEAQAAGEAGPEAEAGPEIEADAQPGPEAAAPEPEAAEAEPEAEVQPEVSPAPALAATAQFDRMRSSPVPPEA